MKKIFLAEDDADDREIFKEVVSDIDSNIEVIAFQNGQTLIAFIDDMDDAAPDLIILDQNMPVLKGSDTLQLLRTVERFKHVPIVIYSTYQDSKFAIECNHQNIELLLKPDTYNELKDMIQKLIETYSVTS